MNILFIGDYKFRKPTATLLFSISKKRTSGPNDFYYATYEDDNHIEYLYKYYKKFIRNIDRLRVLKIKKEDRIKLAKSFTNWNDSLWLKLTSIYYLQKNIKKIMYIDSDCVVDSNIEDFYNISLENNIFAGVNEQIFFSDTLAYKNHPFLRQANDTSYICAGVLLIDCLNFKKMFKSVEEIRLKYEEISEICTFNEQDFINYYCNKYIKFINDDKYMFFTNFGAKFPKKDISIYHYAGPLKPWKNVKVNTATLDYFKFKKIFWKYAIKPFKIFSYLKYFLWPLIQFYGLKILRKTLR